MAPRETFSDFMDEMMWFLGLLSDRGPDEWRDRASSLYDRLKHYLADTPPPPKRVRAPPDIRKTKRRRKRRK